ncbi:DUF1499 domain-containing protein [Qingshengfaniella alkalisoli]|uniref:DUF1499 domain-containing protein n=1 Tax=Qingshengfaniella alkalisoli TaxID=2599296 RepID=A0A5B8IV10_9RHOB|nr:DUF1499 domain-containing protein [Qingshengfaniella alkalisoli]QDY68701.1 DUF1499 domain-containing protein [Qingshengfaniella alkalisoli]
MQILINTAIIIAVLVAAFGLWVRVAPSNEARWHVDPLRVEGWSKAQGYLVRPNNGDAATPVFNEDAEGVLMAFDQIAMSTPRVIHLAGSVDTGMLTYEIRSLVWGFPDYLTVHAVPDDGGTSLAIWSRARYGKSDMGVNRKRVEDWLSQMPS